jgi:uncharacterized repeat protein (TIGR01451 family)
MKPVLRRVRWFVVVAGLLGVVAAVNAPGAAASSPLDPTVSCATDPNIFNTGYDAATGGVLANNSTDANWQVSGPYFASTDGTSPVTATSLPPNNATWALANVGAVAPGAYATSPYSNAQWISQQTIASPNQGTGSDNADWYYEYDFNLASTVDASTFSVAMNFLADNDVAQVWVNGVAQSGLTTGLPQDSGSNAYDFGGYQLGNAAATLLDNDWQSGANSIIVEIKSGPPEEGFDAQLRPSASCPINLAPDAAAPSPDPYTPGQALTYSMSVTNSGPGSVADATVSDALPSALAGGGFTWTCVPSSGSFCTSSGSGSVDDTVDLEAGGTLTYTLTGTVPTGATGTLSNSLTVTPPASASDTGCDPDCTTTTNDPEADPQLTITPSVTSSGPYDADGQAIDYQYIVTNSGNVTMSGVRVDDVATSPAGALTSGPSCQSLASPTGSCSGATTTLAPGQSATFTSTYAIAQADLDSGSVERTDSATGDAPGCSSQSCATTTAGSATTVDLTQSPALGIVKSVTSSGPYDAVGQTVDYRYLVTNTGNVTMTAVGVDDAQSAPAGALTAGPSCQSLATPAGSCSGSSTTLAPGQSATFTGSYAITQSDLDNGAVRGSADASGDLPGCHTAGCATTSTGSSTIVNTTQSSALTLVESVASSGPYEEVGQAIDYQFVVTNTGDVTLSGVAVTDLQTAPAGALRSGPACASLASPSGACAGSTATLAPGQSATFTASYAITQADLDSGAVASAATAAGDPPGCGSASCAATTPGASATVDLAQAPALTIASSSPVTSFATAGSTIALDFVVTNTGNVTLSGIAVDESVSAPAMAANLSAVSCPGGSVAPGASETCVATYVVTAADVAYGSVSDSATATSTGPGEASPTTTSPATLTIPAVVPTRAASHAAVSNAFSVTPDGIEHGDVRLAVEVPGAGKVAVAAWHWVPSNLRPRSSGPLTMFVVGALGAHATGAGTPHITLALNRRGRAMLGFVGSYHFTLTFLVEVTFTPTGGTPRSKLTWVHVAHGRPWLVGVAKRR